MSSRTYSTELAPDPLLRRVVITTGVVATMLGTAMILILPIQPAWRLLAGVVWLLQHGRALLLIARGNKRCERLRIAHDGAASIMTGGQFRTPARLVAGSIVLRRIAWLRFETEDGQRLAELIRCNGAQNENWRRLQVIWRHLGAER
ncbi:MAG: hypothetical protein OEM60_11615 [Gammaproteobacteria bacterium]|nr:hypothetical protein [Gammaproteobacteria bacterium]